MKNTWILVIPAILALAVGGAAAAQGAGVAVILHDESVAPVAFAAGDVREALEGAGLSVMEKPLAELEKVRSPVRIILTTADDDAAKHLPKKPGVAAAGSLGEQAFTVRIEKRAGGTDYRVVGGDAVGAMYGGLDLAEQIRLGKGLDAVTPVTRRPYHRRRGIKFNIPLDARTPSYDDSGDAAQTNYVHMWDFAFWREFLDAMARDRFNTLTLWNPHPFPSIVKLPDYPDVALRDVCVPASPPVAARRPMFAAPEVIADLKVVKKMTIDEKIAHWRRVMRHAKNRGIDIYFITWNVLTNGAEGKYGITNAQDNPKTIAYLRQCTRECLLTYPDLAGIGVTAGENMKHRGDEFSKEKWLWKSYGMGVVDAKKVEPDRKVRFIHRVWQTGVGEVMRQFGDKYPDSFELSFKYVRAHMYSTPKSPFAADLCREMKPYGVKCWWNLRNDDIFNFRWGDPDYARAFLLNLPPGQTAGYHMGSDGYVWGREFTSLDADSPRQLEIKKHWYRFMLWGRLGYNPKLDRAFFEKVLADRFPEAPAARLYDAWASASKIIPLVNRFHWRNWDFMWAVEGCMDNRGFHSVNDFINTKPMEQSGMVSIPDYVQRRLSGKPAGGITPAAVADKLHEYAQHSLEAAAAIRRGLPKEDSADGASSVKELRRTLADIEAMAYLGEYYSAKILGAVELCAYRKSNSARRKEAAIAHLTEAAGHWESYAKIAAAHYRPQVLARTRRLDWKKTTGEVRGDIEIARKGDKL